MERLVNFFWGEDPKNLEERVRLSLQILNRVNPIPEYGIEYQISPLKLSLRKTFPALRKLFPELSGFTLNSIAIPKRTLWQGLLGHQLRIVISAYGPKSKIGYVYLNLGHFGTSNIEATILEGQACPVDLFKDIRVNGSGLIKLQAILEVVTFLNSLRPTISNNPINGQEKKD